MTLVHCDLQCQLVWTTLALDEILHSLAKLWLLYSLSILLSSSIASDYLLDAFSHISLHKTIL